MYSAPTMGPVVRRYTSVVNDTVTFGAPITSLDIFEIPQECMYSGTADVGESLSRNQHAVHFDWHKAL